MVVSSLVYIQLHGISQPSPLPFDVLPFLQLQPSSSSLLRPCEVQLFCFASSQRTMPSSFLVFPGKQDIFKNRKQGPFTRYTIIKDDQIKNLMIEKAEPIY